MQRRSGPVCVRPGRLRRFSGRSSRLSNPLMTLEEDNARNSHLQALTAALSWKNFSLLSLQLHVPSASLLVK